MAANDVKNYSIFYFIFKHDKSLFNCDYMYITWILFGIKIRQYFTLFPEFSAPEAS